jgi:hypothetical protein
MGVRASRLTPQACPACERFIGPAAVCPYCGCDAAVSPAVRLLRLGAVLLATVGLAFLYLAARARDLPQVSADGLSPRMTHAAVSLAGTVQSKPYVATERGVVNYLSFRVHDGTGSVRVQAYDRVARELVAKTALPAKGQRVGVRGNLSVSGDGEARVRLRAAADLVVEAVETTAPLPDKGGER